jgi:transposase
MKTKSNRRSAGGRAQKEEHLPQIAELAREGLNSRQIAERLDISKSSVNDWLRELREEPEMRSRATLPRPSARRSSFTP